MPFLIRVNTVPPRQELDHLRADPRGHVNPWDGWSDAEKRGYRRLFQGLPEVERLLPRLKDAR